MDSQGGLIAAGQLCVEEHKRAGCMLVIRSIQSKFGGLELTVVFHAYLYQEAKRSVMEV